MESFEYSSSKQLPVLGLLFLYIFPVLHGCESLQCKDGDFTAAETVPVKMTVQSRTNLQGQNLDMLIFNNDALQYLECWQRVTVTEDNKVTVASMNGDKVLMACSGMSTNNYEDWMWISSLSSLSDAWTDLEDESLNTPVMSGSCTFKAGSTIKDIPELSLRRVSSEIHLRSLTCDFAGRAYEGEKLSDVQIYLTNVNASCLIWNDSCSTSRIVNQGRLIMEDVARFSDSSLIWQKVDEDIGAETVNTDIRLRCYPNKAQEEGPGTPYTRLVIQGVLDGEIWYWPIDINRDVDTSDEGIGRNCIYRYDIILTRKGSADPDTAIKTGSALITMEVEEWEEKENYSVVF